MAARRAQRQRRVRRGRQVLHGRRAARPEDALRRLLDAADRGRVRAAAAQGADGRPASRWGLRHAALAVRRLAPGPNAPRARAAGATLFMRPPAASAPLALPRADGRAAIRPIRPERRVRPPRQRLSVLLTERPVRPPRPRLRARPDRQVGPPRPRPAEAAAAPPNGTRRPPPRPEPDPTARRAGARRGAARAGRRGAWLLSQPHTLLFATAAAGRQPQTYLQEGPAWAAVQRTDLN